MEISNPFPLFSMARFDCIIHGDSSFSRLAAILGGPVLQFRPSHWAEIRRDAEGNGLLDKNGCQIVDALMVEREKKGGNICNRQTFYIEDALLFEPAVDSVTKKTEEKNKKSICMRVALKEGMTEEARVWLRTLMDRQQETLESLRQEGVSLESVFLDRQPSGDFLIYYMRAEDIDHAISVFGQSTLAIGAYHKDCWTKCCGEAQPLEELLDLDLASAPTH